MPMFWGLSCRSGWLTASDHRRSALWYVECGRFTFIGDSIQLISNMSMYVQQCKLITWLIILYHCFQSSFSVGSLIQQPGPGFGTMLRDFTFGTHFVSCPFQQCVHDLISEDFCDYCVATVVSFLGRLLHQRWIFCGGDRSTGLEERK